MEILHRTVEQLELYALGGLPESLASTVEEHLLVCGPCQKCLDEVEVFALAMRRAISEQPMPQLGDAPNSGRWRLPTWTLAFAVGLAALVVAVVLIPHSRSDVAPLASLQLTAVRGAMEWVGRAAETDVILADAPAGPALRVEVVDAGGGTVWSAPADAGKVKITKPLSEGSYFVRLYDGGKLLHEYGFRVRGL